MVPITSDLAGYATFWEAWLIRIACGAGVFGVTVIVLLYLIYRKLP